MTTQDPESKRRKHLIWFASTAATIVGLACIGTDWSGSRGQDKPDTVSDSSSPSPTSHSMLGKAYANGTVTEVVDGDTLHVEDDDDKTWKVRVLGIDAPEVTSQCWGDEAAEFATDTLTDEHVTLYTDPSQDDSDGADDLLAYVVLDDGTNYSVAAVEAGAARVGDTSDPVKLADEIESAASDAKADSLGLWGNPCDGDIKTPEEEPSSSDETSKAPATADDEGDGNGGGGDGGDGDGGGSVYYANCAEARAAGAAPIYIGEPGYRKGLDRDGDGIACDT